ncbi:hypothetical protein BGX31_011136 [Mortierella sp. GBA43]|nr:hypothetical protein BGX31_011136 [Mortierella sp. GBA43]
MAVSPQSSSSGLLTPSVSAGSSGVTTTGAGSSAVGVLLPQVPNYQVQQDMVPVLITKRIATWRYLQRVHQGGMVFFNTAMLSETDLRRGYTDEKVQRRTLQYFLLGTSLATILEIPNVTDCLKAVHGVVQEYEYFTASESKSKMPFNLDYVITFASLCDMIAQLYEKLAAEERAWTLTNMELFQKIDSRFKKILTLVSKELEIMARELMVDELNAVDPLGTPNDHDWDA